MDALVSATHNSAHAAGIASTHGTLEIGKKADLVILGANPLEDIAATTAIHLVIKDGRIAHRAAAQEQVKE
jgi:imidazolonepropionase-like amidohydrolase